MEKYYIRIENKTLGRTERVRMFEWGDCLRAEIGGCYVFRRKNRIDNVTNWIVVTSAFNWHIFRKFEQLRDFARCVHTFDDSISLIDFETIDDDYNVKQISE